MLNVLAMILAGGRVDELDVLTFFRPKSVVPFGGVYSIIDFPLSNLMHSGIEKVGILSQYRPFYLMGHIANGAPWDMVGRDRFASILPPFKGGDASDWYKGTADAVYQNIDFIKLYNPDLVLILSGDHIYRMDYQEIIRFHQDKKADLTIAFTETPEEGSDRFGQASIQDEGPEGGRVLQYLEKPKKGRLDWASLTIYAFQPDVLIDALEENAKKSSHEFGKDILPSLVGQGSVYGYKHRGYWGYTRTLEEYWKTNMALLGEKPLIDLKAWKIQTNLADKCTRDRQPAVVGPHASIKDSLFYSGCRIDGKVTRSILFPGVTVAEGAEVHESILFFDVSVGPGAKVTRTISDTGVAVGPGAVIGEDRPKELTLLGMNTRIPDRITIESGVTLYPHLTSDRFDRDVYHTGEIVK
jgi:glucose-1-phosphate adenylyltransferase